MIDIDRYNGSKEFEKLLKMFDIVPTNTEIVERTKVSKGSVSQIMLGKRNPTKRFIDKFIAGFGLEIKEIIGTKNTKPTGEGLTLKEFNEHLLKENEFLKAMLLKK